MGWEMISICYPNGSVVAFSIGPPDERLLLLAACGVCHIAARGRALDVSALATIPVPSLDPWIWYTIVL